MRTHAHTRTRAHTHTYRYTQTQQLYVDNASIDSSSPISKTAALSGSCIEKEGCKKQQPHMNIY